jgi:hypothetical protein
MKYTELTFTELVNKIGSSRFFDLPKMLKEVLSRLAPQEPKYKVYTALLTQSGTDAPVATVLENTLGNITFSYNSDGNFNINSSSLFTINKTYVSISSNDELAIVFRYFQEDENIINIASGNSDTSIFSNYFNNTPIEIRVYN